MARKETVDRDLFIRMVRHAAEQDRKNGIIAYDDQRPVCRVTRPTKFYAGQPVDFATENWPPSGYGLPDTEP